MNQRSGIVALAAVVSVALCGTAAAAEATDMIGTWKWTDYTIQVAECTTNPSGAGLCATVIDGPQNKGMEMIRSKVDKKGDNFIAQIAHPATSEIYATKMTFSPPDTWHMDGCTSSGVCAKGDFNRVK